MPSERQGFFVSIHSAGEQRSSKSNDLKELI